MACISDFSSASADKFSQRPNSFTIRKTMAYSIHNFLRKTTEKTKALDQMASYIHQNTDMKVYLFLNLDDYADFEAIQEHYHGRIKWVVNSVETCPFGFLESCPLKLIQELGKPVYTNKRKIRENKPSSLLFLTYRD